MRIIKTAFLILVLISIISSAYATDLSDFPENFFNGNNFDAYVVVGKDGTAIDVISQSLIGMKINLYASSPQRRINKLDNEIDIENNLILIGNPCTNT